MNILISNDSRNSSLPDFDKYFQRGVSVDEEIREKIRQRINWDSSLCDVLVGRGHNVVLFDCHENDLVSEIDNSAAAAQALDQSIATFAPDVLLFDLHYFEHYKQGPEMLRWLDTHSLTVHNVNVLIGTRYLSQRPYYVEGEDYSEAALMKQFHFVKACINRFTVSTIDVVAFIEGHFDINAQAWVPAKLR
jgi:hypothetical protein